MHHDYWQEFLRLEHQHVPLNSSLTVALDYVCNLSSSIKARLTIRVHRIQFIFLLVVDPRFQIEEFYENFLWHCCSKMWVFIQYQELFWSSVAKRTVTRNG